MVCISLSCRAVSWSLSDASLSLVLLSLCLASPASLLAFLHSAFSSSIFLVLSTFSLFNAPCLSWSVCSLSVPLSSSSFSRRVISLAYLNSYINKKIDKHNQHRFTYCLLSHCIFDDKLKQLIEQSTLRVTVF